MLRRALAIAVIGFTAAVAPALAEPTFVSFQVPQAISTRPTAINSAGDVAGAYLDSSYHVHGFVRLADGTLKTFSAVSRQNPTYPTQINDKGEIAGVFYIGDIPRGFLRNPNGNLKVIEAPGTDRTFVTGLNNNGLITGYALVDQNTYRGFTREPNGTFALFNAIEGASKTQSLVINDTGTVAGFYSANNFTHFFIRTAAGDTTTFDVTTDLYGNVRAINPDGTVAGASGDLAFVRAPNGHLVTFELKPHKGYTVPTGMNADGTVSGYYSDRKLHVHGFLRARDRTVTTFDYPTADFATSPLAINDSNMVTGSYTENGIDFGFVRIP